MDIDTGENPPYSEILERFGANVSTGEAIEVTHYIQRQYPDLVAIGGITATPQIYGEKDIRESTRDLDFVGSFNEINKAIEEHEETWSYMGCYVFVEDLNEEWMVAMIPNNIPCFDESSGYEPFCVDPHEVENPVINETEQGDIRAVSPETSAVSKIRRYFQFKEERNSYKEGDLLDLWNMMLADSRGNTEISKDTLRYEYSRLAGDDPVTEMIIDDMEDAVTFNSEDLEEAEIQEGLENARDHLDGI